MASPSFFNRPAFSVWVERYKDGRWQAGVLTNNPTRGHGGLVRVGPISAMRAAIRNARLCRVL